MVSNFKSMVICLTLVCLFCSAALGGVYALTEAPIEATNKAILEKSIGAVLPEDCTISEAMEIEVGGQKSEYYRADRGAEIVGFAVKSSVVGFGGPLTLIVGILPDGTVYNTSVYSHSETPGLGAKCTSDEKFMGQWKGLKPESYEGAGDGKILKVTKDGGNIDAITASTITSRAYTKAVRNAVDALFKLAQTPMPISGECADECAGECSGKCTGDCSGECAGEPCEKCANEKVNE